MHLYIGKNNEHFGGIDDAVVFNRCTAGSYTCVRKMGTAAIVKMNVEIECVFFRLSGNGIDDFFVSCCVWAVSAGSHNKDDLFGFGKRSKERGVKVCGGHVAGYVAE